MTRPATKFLSTTRPSFTASANDRISIRTIHVAFALSLVLHAALLWGWLPRVPMLPFEDTKLGKPSGSLAVHLVSPFSHAPTPAPESVMQAPASPAHRTPMPKMANLPPSAPVLARQGPAPSAVPAPAEAARPPADQDFAAAIEAHRRARTQSEPAPPPSPPAESEQERHNREVAARLGLNRTPSFGAERNRGGGMFQIERMGYNDAEFFFFGWNKSINRNSQQMIAVSRGSNPSMEIAVVRKMIAIIREHANSDFVWESQRLNREVRLSARAADNAGLEDFLMREFFADARTHY